MVKLSKSKIVEKLARKAFLDLDHDGTLDAKELHVALLLFYDKLNKALPVYFKPPGHEEVQALLRKYDADSSGHLNFEEFHQCVRSMVGLNENAKFTDSVPFMIGSRMLLKMALFPLAAYGLKKLLVELVGEEAEKVPTGALAFGVEGLYKLGAVTLQR